MTRLILAALAGLFAGTALGTWLGLHLVYTQEPAQ